MEGVSMRDTIYRDDAIRVASGYCHPANVAKELEKLPSGEPEIIRCKDCEYFHKSFCEIWSKFGTIQTRENGYCYMAERRTDG